MLVSVKDEDLWRSPRFPLAFGVGFEIGGRFSVHTKGRENSGFSLRDCYSAHAKPSPGGFYETAGSVNIVFPLLEGFGVGFGMAIYQWGLPFGLLYALWLGH
jgi:hypothetical protein